MGRLSDHRDKEVSIMHALDGRCRIRIKRNGHLRTQPGRMSRRRACLIVHLSDRSSQQRSIGARLPMKITAARATRPLRERVPGATELRVEAPITQRIALNASMRPPGASTEHPARACAGRLPAFEYEPAIHQDVANSNGGLRRPLERCGIEDGPRIEHANICVAPLANLPTVRQPKS